MKRGVPTLLLLALLVAAAVAVAGCAKAGGNANSHSSSYKGQFVDLDLYLYPLSASGPKKGWMLYRDSYVDAWAFANETDPSKATIPGPMIHVREGDTVRITFQTVGAPMAHTIHWHGIHVPWDQDGVPYVSQLPIGMADFDGHGPIFTYQFQLNQSGTYWYHCHVDTAHHVDMGMYGAFIVDPADPEQDPHADQDVTLMLDEWDKSHAHQNQMAITNAISKSGDPSVTANDLYSFMRDYLVMNSYYRQIAKNASGSPVGTPPGVQETRTWYPVTYPPYFAEYDTFLINGHAFPDTEPIYVKTGQVLRLRFINAGEEVHAMHLHGHYMYVTHKDGSLIPALQARGHASDIKTEDEMRKYAQAEDTILIGPGERYDVLVYLNNPGPWMLHDHISLHEANDYINPGGMMTMLCYTDGWKFDEKLCQHGQAMHAMGQAFTSGDMLQAQYNLLLGKDPFAAVQPGGGPAIVPTTGASMPGMDGMPGMTTSPSDSVSPSPTLPIGSIGVPDAPVKSE